MRALILISLSFFPAIGTAKTHIPQSFKFCTTYTKFEKPLGDALAKGDTELFKRLLMEHTKKYNNVGVKRIKFSEKEEKLVFRSAYLSEKPSCLMELVIHYKVQHIINLSYPTHFDVTPWIEKEREMFIRLLPKGEDGQYISYNDLAYSYEEDPAQNPFLQKLIKIIHVIRNLQGNVLIHCSGGEHKTGILMGILEKCYNHTPMHKIIEDYKHHAAWKDSKNPGGVKEKDLKLIRNFPCNMLHMTP